jgi:hypothetical protein
MMLVETDSAVIAILFVATSGHRNNRNNSGKEGMKIMNGSKARQKIGWLRRGIVSKQNTAFVWTRTPYQRV